MRQEQLNDLESLKSINQELLEKIDEHEKEPENENDPAKISIEDHNSTIADLKLINQQEITKLQMSLQLLESQNALL